MYIYIYMKHAYIHTMMHHSIQTDEVQNNTNTAQIIQHTICIRLYINCNAHNSDYIRNGQSG